MKKLHSLYFFLLYFVLFSSALLANVTITQASGGTNIHRYYALNGSTPKYTTLGDVVIEENSNCNISSNQSNVTLILTAPDNWQFKAGAGSATYRSGGDITGISINVTSKTITVTFNTDSWCNRDDRITINGIQVIAIDGWKCSERDIYGSGTAKISGITFCGLLKTSGITCCTIFGKLSLKCDDPLPVELTSFNALIKNHSVYLNWETATEKSNYGFEVERSTNKINWIQITFINGCGNSNSPKKYSYIDDKISSGNYYYRLKQIDTDGAFDYSKEIEVSIDNLPIAFALEQNYPNPFNPATKINYALPTDRLVVLTIYDAIGKEVATIVNEYEQAGNYSIEFNGSTMPSGMYFYRLQAGSFVETKKMLLLK